MIALDEDALICDLAQYYRVYDYRGLPLKMVATLANGLPPDSRIRTKQFGLKVPFSAFLFAQIKDELAAIRWLNSSDGEKGVNRPEFMAVKLIEREEYNGKFTPDEFEQFRANLAREGDT